MSVRALLGKRVTAIALVGLIGLGLSGCLADTSATPPSDGNQLMMYNAVNADRTANGVSAAGVEPEARQPRHAVGEGNGELQHVGAPEPRAADHHVGLRGYHTMGENILVAPPNTSAGADGSRMVGVRRPTAPTS